MTGNEWLEEFSENLMFLIKEKKYTQEEVAKEAGLSDSALSSYINGIRKPGIKAVINISYVLDCSIDELVDFDEMIE